MRRENKAAQLRRRAAGVNRRVVLGSEGKHCKHDSRHVLAAKHNTPAEPDGEG